MLSRKRETVLYMGAIKYLKEIFEADSRVKPTLFTKK
jgi:hypothetical protein